MSSRRLAPFLLLLGLAGCGGPQVTITLIAADDLLVPPEFLRFVFRPVDAEPIEVGPFNTGALPANDFVEVPPGVVFSIDAIGCKSDAREDCETEDTFVARGCEGELVRGRDDALAIEIEVHGAVTGNDLCPVEDPDGDRAARR